MLRPLHTDKLSADSAEDQMIFGTSSKNRSTFRMRECVTSKRAANNFFNQKCVNVRHFHKSLNTRSKGYDKRIERSIGSVGQGVE